MKMNMILHIVSIALLQICSVENAIIKKNDIPQGNTASVLFGGDISLDKPIRTNDGAKCQYEGLLAGVSKYFNEVDYNIVNLESPFVTREQSTRTFLPNKGIHNMAWPEGIAALKAAGIKGVTIANNHIGDSGPDSAIFTRDWLLNNTFDVVGLTLGLENYEKQKPLIKEVNGVRIGILAYCGDNTHECAMYRIGQYAGTAILDRPTVERDMVELKPQVDIVIVFLHWGTEYMTIPNEDQRELATILRDLGVDLIVGSHPHVLQGHEWINDTLIHYSLGNFVFHPHSTFMGGLSNRKNKSAIHKRAIEQSKKSRGPASYTELLKVEFNKTGIINAYYLPVRIHVDPDTFCLYPRPLEENGWLKICGEEDRNCYAPRHGEPIYP